MWGEVTDEDNSSTERLRVEGGWIYRCRTWSGEHCDSMAICFVPEKTKDGGK